VYWCVCWCVWLRLWLRLYLCKDLSSYALKNEYVQKQIPRGGGTEEGDCSILRFSTPSCTPESVGSGRTGRGLPCIGAILLGVRGLLVPEYAEPGERAEPGRGLSMCGLVPTSAFLPGRQRRDERGHTFTTQRSSGQSLPFVSSPSVAHDILRLS